VVGTLLALRPGVEVGAGDAFQAGDGVGADALVVCGCRARRRRLPASIRPTEFGRRWRRCSLISVPPAMTRSSMPDMIEAREVDGGDARAAEAVEVTPEALVS